MVITIILFSLLVSDLPEAVSVYMIPKTGTPPSARDLPGFTSDLEVEKLYIYGGRNESPLDDMWEFDLSTESWREIHHTSSISPGHRSEPYLFAKESCKLLLFGGISQRGPVSDLWEFDIDNQYWKIVNDIGERPPRSYYRAVCSYEKDGKKYPAVYGGAGFKDYVQTLHILNLETYTWKMYKNNGIPAPFTEASQLSYVDGSFYIWESIKNNYSSTPSLFRFDLNSSSWSIIETSGTSPDYLQANGQCAYNNSLYFIYGYYRYQQNYLTRIYRINLETNNKVWEEFNSSAGSLMIGAFGYVCSGNSLYMFGGASRNGQTNQILKFDFTSYNRDATELSKSMITPKARYGHAMEVYDDKLYILGGRDAGGKDLIDVSTFDLSTETWDTLLSI